MPLVAPTYVKPLQNTRGSFPLKGLHHFRDRVEWGGTNTPNPIWTWLPHVHMSGYNEG